MNRRQIFPIIFLPFLLTGCFTKTEKPADIVNPALKQTPVSLGAFDDIQPEQVGESFIVNGDTYVIVQQPSMNIPLSLSEDASVEFVGVLKQAGEDGWIKVAQIEDVFEEGETSPKNNPIAIWEEKGAVRVAIVDQTGAGSGEGVFKIFVFKDERVWVQESCGYFEPEKGNFLTYEDRIKFEYFQFSSIEKSYQSGPTFIKELGEERMINEPACDNVFVSSIIE